MRATGSFMNADSRVVGAGYGEQFEQTDRTIKIWAAARRTQHAGRSTTRTNDWTRVRGRDLVRNLRLTGGAVLQDVRRPTQIIASSCTLQIRRSGRDKNR